jgi:hypothetical protein
MSKIYYSAEANGFYIEGLHADIPDDRIEITAEEHNRLMGQQVYPGPDGRPIAGDNPPARPQYSRWMIPGVSQQPSRKKRDK